MLSGYDAWKTRTPPEYLGGPPRYVELEVERPAPATEGEPPFWVLPVVVDMHTGRVVLVEGGAEIDLTDREWNDAREVQADEWADAGDDQ